MKKIGLILITLLTFTININASNNKIDSTIKSEVLKLPDSTQLTFKEVYSDIKAGLSGLGSALKVGSEHVYEVLVKQQVVFSITMSLVLLIGILGFISFAGCFYSKNRYRIKSRWNYDKDRNQIEEFYKDESEWNDPHITKTIITGIISGIFLLVGLLYLNDIITGFVNPEYGAIQDILKIIK